VTYPVLAWQIDGQTILPNDEIDGAIPIAANASVSGSTIGATGLDITRNGYNDFLDVWYWGNSIIMDCMLSYNQATLDGGGICCRSGSDPKVNNCNFIDNSASSGGGIFCDDQTEALILNNIISSNTGTGIYVIYSSPVIKFNDLYNNNPTDYGGWAWPGEGDISDDPYFIESGNYHLQPDSPCINAGDPAFVPETGETDIGGDSRVRLGRVDIGADEAGSHPADVNEDGIVDLIDFNLLATAWLSTPALPNWDTRCDIHVPKDDIINLPDMTTLSDAWLWQAGWYEP
jgi:parallel beta-helix repeat protein